MPYPGLTGQLAEAFEEFAAEQVAAFDQSLRYYPQACRLADHLRDHLQQGGKRIRPLLTLGTAEAFAPGTGHSRLALACAFALEAFHTFILMHDDVIDRSPQRRGRPTLHKVLEQQLQLSPENAANVTIVLGDLIFSLAAECLSKACNGNSHGPALAAYFHQIVRDTGLGESLELINLDRPVAAVSSEEIATIYFLKTTRYTMEAPLLLGAMAAGVPRESVAPVFEAYARQVGLAFQVDNDLHEIKLPPEDFARLGYDFQTGVKTVFLHRLHQALSPAGQARLDDLLRPSGGDQAETARQFHQLAHASGLIPILEEEVRTLLAQGKQALSSAPLPTATTTRLIELADMVESLCHHSEQRA